MLILLGLIASLSLISYSLWKRARGQPPDEALLAGPTQLRLPGAEPSLSSLGPGDVVSHLGTDHLVEGVLRLDDDGRLTCLYRMTDGTRVRWLAVRAGADEPLVCDAVPGLIDPDGLAGHGGSLPGQSTPEQLFHQGAPYRLASRAMVRVERVGAVGVLPPADRAWLCEYAGAGVRRIVALIWRDRVETFAGEPVARSMIEVLPGPGLAT